MRNSSPERSYRLFFCGWRGLRTGLRACATRLRAGATCGNALAKGTGAMEPVGLGSIWVCGARLPGRRAIMPGEAPEGVFTGLKAAISGPSSGAGAEGGAGVENRLPAVRDASATTPASMVTAPIWRALKPSRAAGIGDGTHVRSVSESGIALSRLNWGAILSESTGVIPLGNQLNQMIGTPFRLTNTWGPPATLTPPCMAGAWLTGMAAGLPLCRIAPHRNIS